MKFDLMGGGLPLRRFAELARDAAAAGFSGIVVTETTRTAYLSCAAGALAADIDLLTGIAVAFPRSPMITAQVAWELAEATGGRFRLGLGSQVRAHIERRFGAAFEPGGPRLREYVLAVRACYAAFRGAPLDFDGTFWQLSFLPASWSPGDIPCPDPPIDVAAVNPWMLRMAGEVADGVHVHPLNHAIYIERSVRPEIEAGAKAAGRSADDIALIIPTLPPPARTPTSSSAGGRTPAGRSPSTGRRRTTPSSSSSSAGKGSRPGSGSARKPAMSRGWRPSSRTTCWPTSA
jgi:probable F420-dependent oxidoreductase